MKSALDQEIERIRRAALIARDMGMPITAQALEDAVKLIIMLKQRIELLTKEIEKPKTKGS